MGHSHISEPNLISNKGKTGIKHRMIKSTFDKGNRKLTCNMLETQLQRNSP